MTRDPGAVARIIGRPRSLAGPDWVPHWALAAHQAELCAEDSVAAEQRLRATRQAAAYYLLAAYPAIEGDDRRWAYARAQRLYRDACRLEGAPAVSVAVSFDGGTFPIVLRRPAGIARGLVLMLRGLDSTKEVTYWDERAILDQGLAIVSADFPGMGDNRCAMTSATDQLYRAALDAALDQLATPALPVTVWGLGFGGYWAYRLAASDPRVVGAISIGGPVHHSFRPGLARVLRHLSEALFLQRIMRTALGPAHRGSVAGFIRRLSLVESGALSSMQTPLLYINGDRDIVVSLREAELVQRHAAAGAQRDVRIFEGASHLASEVLESEVLPLCLSWTAAAHDRAFGVAGLPDRHRAQPRLLGQEQ